MHGYGALSSDEEGEDDSGEQFVEHYVDEEIQSIPSLLYSRAYIYIEGTVCCGRRSLSSMSMFTALKADAPVVYYCINPMVVITIEREQLIFSGTAFHLALMLASTSGLH